MQKPNSLKEKSWFEVNRWWFILHPIGTLRGCLMWMSMPVKPPLYTPISGVLIFVSLAVCWNLSSVVPFVGIWHTVTLGIISLVMWFAGLMITRVSDLYDQLHPFDLLSKSALTGPVWCSLVPLVIEVIAFF